MQTGVVGAPVNPELQEAAVQVPKTESVAVPAQLYPVVVLQASAEVGDTCSRSTSGVHQYRYICYIECFRSTQEALTLWGKRRNISVNVSM